MLYYMVCDFSSLKCDRNEIAKILTRENIEFHNINNFLWELNVPENYIMPFSDTPCKDISMLFHRYISKEAVFLIIKADNYYYHDGY